MHHLGGRGPTLGFGIAVLIGFGIGAFILIHLQNFIHYNARVNHTLTVLDPLATSLALLVDAETGQRGYLLTGDVDYLEPYRLATLSEGSLRDYLQQLGRLTSDNPTQQQYLARLEPLVEERFVVLQRGIDLRREAGFEAAQNFVQDGQGKATMDEIRRVFAAMRREENELLTQRSTLASTNLQRTRYTLIIGASASLAFAATSFSLFAREVRARRRAEEELRYLNDELKTQVGEYVSALLSAKIALQHYAYRVLESEDDYRYMVELNPQVPWTADPEGNILDFNSRWLELTGLSREAALGTGWTQAPHPDDLPQMETAWTASVSAGVPYDIEHRLRLADGSYRWMRSRAYPRHDANGEIVRWYGTTEDIHDHKEAQERIERQLSQLESLRAIDLAILGTTDVRLTLKTVLAELRNSLKVDAGVIMLHDPQTLTLEIADLFGFYSPGIENVRPRLGQGIMGGAALEGRIMEYPNLALAPPSEFSSFPLEVEKIQAFYAVPLTAKGKLVGVLGVGHRSALEPTPEWRSFLETLAGQAAMAIDSANAFNDLQRSNLNLTLAYDTTIEGWSRALDLRDKETEGHSLRVTEMTLKLARAVGMSEDELVHLRRGALLHDIGKMGVPDAVLLKPDKLTNDEWNIMRRHPGYAYDLLVPIAFLHPALDIPYCHHEKWDGTGYPRQLKGEQIPLAARIFAVVDVWDALRSDRPYRQGWSDEKVRDYLRSESGVHFDPQIVAIFLDLLEGEENVKSFLTR
jgi:PAS domain S-box-containing protein